MVRVFIARHGLHFQDGDHIVDFVICFTCNSMSIHGHHDLRGIEITFIGWQYFEELVTSLDLLKATPSPYAPLLKETNDTEGNLIAPKVLN